MNGFNFPKAELHCHLDGCFRLTTIIEIAKERGVTLPTYDVNELRKYCVIKRCPDLKDFLKRFDIFSPVIAGCLKAIKRNTRETIQDKASQGVAYLELRSCPFFWANSVEPMFYCAERGDVTPRDVLQAICDEARDAAAEFRIVVRIILCAISNLPQWSMEIAEMCRDFASQGVVGFDIAGCGDDDGEVMWKHKAAFDFCKARGISRTAHAGEMGNAKEVETAIEVLHAQRIGHGYHVVRDEGIFDKAKSLNIHFEVCPRSSYLTSAVDADLTKHPAIRFRKEDVNFSLSTDDPGIQQSTILTDYEIARKDFRFSDDDLKALNINALKSAFVEEPVKERLIQEFKAAYAKHTNGEITEKIASD